MKKLVAFLMVLCMLMSCTAFAAEKTSTQTVAQLYINPQLVASMGLSEETKTLIDTINSLTFTTTTGENVVTVAYGANDTDICEYTVATTEEGGLLYFSSLYPNTAILLDFAKVAALIEQALPMEAEEWLNQAQSAWTEIGDWFAPYVEDVDDLLATMQSEALVDESGMNVYLSITSKHLAQLLDAWMTRLAGDANMQTVLSMIYTAAMENEYGAPSFEEFFNQLRSEVDDLKNTDEVMELGTVGVYASEDGTATYEVTIANQLLVSMDVYTYEGMDCLDLLVIVSNGTSDWQATYDGIYNGTNYSDMMFGVGVASYVDYTYTQAYVIEAGQVMSATLEETVENAGTDDQKIQTVLSIDMAQGDQSINLGGYAAETVLVDDYTMPSLDDKYVLDIMALPIDMLMNGLPQFAENVVAGMPEVVNMVLDALSEVEGLEFLQTLTIPETETAADPVEAVTDEVPAETTTVITTVTTDDEIAPREAPKTEGVIEDM